MPASPLIPCAGLQSDRNKLEAPRGGLRRADNVVIDAPGVASARPNFETDATKVSDFRVRAMRHHDGIALHVTTDGTDWQLETQSVVYVGVATLVGDATPPSPTFSATQFAAVRGSLYLTTSEGVKKAWAEDATLFLAGHNPSPAGKIEVYNNGGTWLLNGYSVAYRWVWTRDLTVDNVDTKSPPSSWSLATNSAGASRGVRLSMPLPSDARIGDVVEIYRSYSVSTGSPSDQMFLVARHTVTSAEIATRVAGTDAGVVVFDDTLPESLIAEELYTNSTREGIENANGRPPWCIALEAWRDSLWFGNTQSTGALIVDSYGTVGTTWYGDVTGDILTGSATILNVSSIANLRVNQLWSSGGSFPANTRIVSAVGTTVVVTQQSTATTVGATCTFRDVVTVGGRVYAAGAATALGSPMTFEVPSGALDDAEQARRIARELAYLISRDDSDLNAQAIEDPDTSLTFGPLTRPGRLLIRNNSGLATITFTTTTATGAFVFPFEEEAAALSTPNRIYYSKPQEPEHVPELNWLTVGDDTGHIQRMVAMASSLLVFTTCGIYRVSGSYPYFSVDVVARGVRLLRPMALDTIGDAIYAWTDQGVLEITEAGIAANLTSGFIRDELTPFAASLDSDTEQDAFVVSWPDKELVLVGMGDGTNRSKTIYAWSRTTRAWSRWTFATERGWTCAAYEASTRTLTYAIGDSWETRSSSTSGPHGYDADYTLSGWDDVGTEVTISTANADPWVPAAGDWLRLDDEWRRILAVETVGSDYVITIDVAFVAASGDAFAAYEGAPAVIEWMGQTAGGPSNGGFVRELQLHLDTADWTNAADATARIVGGASSDNAAASTLVATPTYASVNSRPVRFGMPRAVARCAHLYPRVELQERFWWRVMGICLVGEGVSEKVRK